MKPRGRDVAAILLTLLLVRIAFLDRSGPESLIVDVNLAFYNELTTTATLLPTTTMTGSGSNDGAGRRSGDDRDDPDRPEAPVVKTASPVTLDVDGDGVAEAIVVPFAAGTKTTGPDGGGGTTAPRWGLGVLDLKPLHATSGGPGTGGLPFRPAAMFASKFESPPSTADGSKDDGGGAKDRKWDGAEESPSSSSLPAVPVKMVSGQLVLHPSHPYAKLKALEAESKESSSTAGGNAESTERSRHYYCGTDWHDAAASCHKHCPSGTSADCPDGMQCYADTPCDSLWSSADGGDDDADDSLNATKLALTPRGSIPSVVTVWSDGAVSLHGITGDVVSDVQIPPGGHGKKGGRHHKVHRPRANLEFRELWRVRPFRRKFWDARGEDDRNVEDDKVWLDFDEVDVALLGPEAPIGKHGAVVVAGTYELRSTQGGVESEDLAAVVALDASSGTKIWSTDDENFSWERNMAAGEVRPGSGRTSRARRRSGIVAPEETGGHAAGAGAEAMMAGDCLRQFRHSVLDPSVGALPHSYWGPGSGHHAAVVVTHFDRRRRHGAAPAAAGAAKRHGGKRDKEPPKKSLSQHRQWQKIMLESGFPAPKLLQPGKPEKSQVPAKARHATAGHDPTKHHHHAHHRDHHHRQRSMSAKHSGEGGGGGLTYGRPNVVLAHNMWGITALSLRNGKPVCHMSLLDHGLYGDFNGDGVVDVVQVVTQANADSAEAMEGEFAKNLLKRIQTEGDATKAAGGGGGARRATVPKFPCHALALSGLPAREQLFDAELCNGGARVERGAGAGSISPAPPLLVEGSSSPNSNDIVFATSDGVVTRLDPSGRRIWKTMGGGGSGGGVLDGAGLLPTWESDGDGTPEPAASLGRIDFSKSYVSFGSSGYSDTAASLGPVRPVVLTGGDGAAILSAGRGRILASTPFPQHSLRHPIYADLNGDGTTDFMVVSADAVWGYTVFVTTGGANFLRIAVGLLLFGMALAVLRNRFSNPEGVDKRSTDP